jgi:hypothetical protein
MTVINSLRRAAIHLLRPLEPAAFQPPVIQPEPVMVPSQDLELVLVPVAEDEKVIGERVKVDALLHQHRERVDGLSKVGGPTGKIDLVRGRLAQYVVESTRTTARKSSGSKPGFTSIPLCLPLQRARATYQPFHR